MIHKKKSSWDLITLRKIGTSQQNINEFSFQNHSNDEELGFK